MKPLAWSYTSLEDYENCPRAFHAKRVLKKYKEERSVQMIWGERVHTDFELRQSEGKELPLDLEEHEDLMKVLEEMPGEMFVEQRIALNTQRQPCDFFSKTETVWMRGVIDWMKVHKDRARIVDYKTGKPHKKFKQLKLFALHTFIAFPKVERAKVEFYWTKTGEATGEVYHRDQMKDLWGEFVPTLRQYVESFKHDLWQPRQSGLCNGWCPVTDCEFWKPKRKW